jgi:histone acetyltransferase MYST4
LCSQVQQNASVPASSPTVNAAPMQMPQQQNSSSKRQMQQPRNRSSTPSTNKQQSNMKLASPAQQHASVQQQQQQHQSRQRAAHSHAQSHQHMLASPTQNQQVQHQMQQQHHAMHHQVAMHQSYSHHPQLGASAMHQHPHHPHHSVINSGNYIPVAVSTQGFPAPRDEHVRDRPHDHRDPAQDERPAEPRGDPPEAGAVAVVRRHHGDQLLHPGESAPARSHPHAGAHPGPDVHPPRQPRPDGQLELQPGQVATVDQRIGHDAAELVQHHDATAGRDDVVAAADAPPARHHDSAADAPDDPEPDRPQPGAVTVGHTVASVGLPQVLSDQHEREPAGRGGYAAHRPESGTVEEFVERGRAAHADDVEQGQSERGALNPNVMYNSLNGYRMAAQQTPGPVTGYIANTAAGFINNAQIPMQMGVMNMAQTQYQDPTAIQRAAQQNTMYTYGYINSVMQPLNGTMRR